MLLSLILVGTVIYVKVAENQAGEADIVLIPTPAANDTRTLDTTNVDAENLQDSFRLINFRTLEPVLNTIEDIQGVAPRWTLKASVYNPDDISGKNLNTSCYIIIADTRKERDIGLGRAFSKTVLGYGEAFATTSILNVLGVSRFQGQRLMITIDFLKSFSDSGVIDADSTTREDLAREILDSFGVLDSITNITVDPNDFIDSPTTVGGVEIEVPDIENITFTSDFTTELVIQSVANLLLLEIPFTVVEAIETADGKWPEAFGNVVLLDANYIKQEVIDSVKSTLQSDLSILGNTTIFDDIIAGLEDFDLFEYTLYANIIIKDRLDTYTGSVEHMKSRFTSITNQIYDKLGYGHPTEPQLLLATQMEGVQIVKTFLNNVFMSVLVFLVILSFILIFSLMMGNVEEKTYEFGMLRSLGMKYATLTQYLLLQCAGFSLPGLLMGLFLSFLLNLIGAYAIGSFTSLDVSLNLHPYAWITGVLIGTLLPLFSVYVPIKRALTATLKDSLDLYHRVVSGLTVTIIKLEKMGLSPPTLVVALLLTFMGFLTYYLVPLAFQLRQFEIFIFLLNIILLFMIVGLTFLVNILQPYFEQ